MVVGTLQAVEPGYIILTDDLRIAVPPEIPTANFSIGSNVTIVGVRLDGVLVAESIKRTRDD
jgi:hypothetical protein